MMGHNHAASGALVAVIALPLLPSSEGYLAVGWVVAVAGAALLPDLDTASSTAARMWGPFSQLLATLVSRVVGGHRWGSHDAVLAPLVLAPVVTFAATFRWGAFCVLALMVGLVLSAARLLGVVRAGWVMNLSASLGAAWWLTTEVASSTYVVWAPLLALAVCVGVVVHIAGDAVTTEGVPVPLMWLTAGPRRGGVPLFSTGGLVESFVVAPLLAGGLIAALWWRMPGVGSWVGSALGDLARLT